MIVPGSQERNKSIRRNATKEEEEEEEERERKDEEIGALEVSNSSSTIERESISLSVLTRCSTQKKKKRWRQWGVGKRHRRPRQIWRRFCNSSTWRPYARGLKTCIMPSLVFCTPSPPSPRSNGGSICFPPRFVCHFFGSSVSRRVKDF